MFKVKTLSMTAACLMAVGLMTVNPSNAQAGHDSRSKACNILERIVQHRHHSHSSHNHRSNSVRVGYSTGNKCTTTVQRRRYVPGHYKTETRRVLVCAGRYERRHVPAVYETRYYPCGMPYRVMVKPACYQNFWVPARYETKCVRVWVPGRWESVPVTVHRKPNFTVHADFRF